MNGSRNSTYSAIDYEIVSTLEDVICYIALALNGLCIIGIVKKPGKLTMRNRLVLSLCASDAMFVIPHVCYTIVTRFDSDILIR